jgi:hypothetical protein
MHKPVPRDDRDCVDNERTFEYVGLGNLTEAFDDLEVFHVFVLDEKS